METRQRHSLCSDLALMLCTCFSRSSGVKSKINKLRSAFNASSRNIALVDLYTYEPAVVASVLKLFLRELPDPVLTPRLMPRFEKVSADPTPQKRIEGMKQLMQELPDCNRQDMICSRSLQTLALKQMLAYTFYHQPKILYVLSF